MDLLSLPNELLASVCKYNKYAINIRLRKLNAHINNVAKVYDIDTRFPVTSITLTSSKSFLFGGLSVLPWEYTLELDSDNLNCHPVLKRKNVTEYKQRFDENIIHNLLKKVNIKGKLKIIDFCLTDSLLATFARNRKSFRDLTMFTLFMTNVSCSDASLRNFVESARKMREYRVSCPGSGALIQTEMLANRKWDYLSLSNSREKTDRPKYPQLNDEFLLKVVKNCKECSIDLCRDGDGCTSFTVDGVIKLIETLVKDGVTPEHIFIEAAYTDDDYFLTAEDKIRNIHSGLICNFDSYSYETQDEDGTNRLITKNNTEISFSSDPDKIFIEFNMVHIKQLEERVNDDDGL